MKVTIFLQSVGYDGEEEPIAVFADEGLVKALGERWPALRTVELVLDSWPAGLEVAWQR